MTGFQQTDHQDLLMPSIVKGLFGGDLDRFETFMKAAQDACAMTNGQFWFERGPRLIIRFINVPVHNANHPGRRMLMRIPDLVYACNINSQHVSCNYGSCSIMTTGSYNQRSPHPHFRASSSGNAIWNDVCFGNEYLNIGNRIDGDMIGMFIMRMYAHATSYSPSTSPYRSYEKHMGQKLVTRPLRQVAYAPEGVEIDYVLEFIRLLSKSPHVGVRNAVKSFLYEFANGTRPSSYSRFLDLMNNIISLVYAGMTGISMPIKDDMHASSHVRMVLIDLIKDIPEEPGYPNRNHAMGSFLKMILQGTCIEVGSSTINIYHENLDNTAELLENSQCVSAFYHPDGTRKPIRLVYYMSDYGMNLENINQQNNEQNNQEDFDELRKVWNVGAGFLSEIQDAILQRVLRNHRKRCYRQIALDSIEKSGGSIPALVQQTSIGRMVWSSALETSPNMRPRVKQIISKLVLAGESVRKQRNIARPNLFLLFKNDQDRWDFRRRWISSAIDHIFEGDGEDHAESGGDHPLDS